MTTEQVCQFILMQILPLTDPFRKGIFLEVGAGTGNWFSIAMRKLRFVCQIVEPLPVPKLYTACKENDISLLIAAMTDKSDNGKVWIQHGRTPDLNSMDDDWWGLTEEYSSVEVPTTTLNDYTCLITCLKLDVEGHEWPIISTLRDQAILPSPKCVMFEYGGGGEKQKGEHGWSPISIAYTQSCISHLKANGYQEMIIVNDGEGPVRMRLDQMKYDHEWESIISPTTHYGNAIAFHKNQGCNIDVAIHQAIAQWQTAYLLTPGPRFV